MMREAGKRPPITDAYRDRQAAAYMQRRLRDEEGTKAVKAALWDLRQKDRRDMTWLRVVRRLPNGWPYREMTITVANRPVNVLYARDQLVLRFGYRQDPAVTLGFSVKGRGAPGMGSLFGGRLHFSTRRVPKGERRA